MRRAWLLLLVTAPLYGASLTTIQIQQYLEDRTVQFLREVDPDVIVYAELKPVTEKLDLPGLPFPVESSSEMQFSRLDMTIVTREEALSTDVMAFLKRMTRGYARATQIHLEPLTPFVKKPAREVAVAKPKPEAPKPLDPNIFVALAIFGIGVLAVTLGKGMSRLGDAVENGVAKVAQLMEKR